MPRWNSRSARYVTASTTGPTNPPGRSTNASGTQSASTNIAAIEPNMATRPMPSSARNTLPTHAKPTQHHQRRQSTSIPRTIPCPVRFAAS